MSLAKIDHQGAYSVTTDYLWTVFKENEFSYRSSFCYSEVCSWARVELLETTERFFIFLLHIKDVSLNTNILHCLLRLLWWLDEIIHIKCFGWGLISLGAHTEVTVGLNETDVFFFLGLLHAFYMIFTNITSLN